MNDGIIGFVINRNLWLSHLSLLKKTHKDFPYVFLPHEVIQSTKKESNHEWCWKEYKDSVKRTVVLGPWQVATSKEEHGVCHGGFV